MCRVYFHHLLGYNLQSDSFLKLLFYNEWRRNVYFVEFVEILVDKFNRTNNNQLRASHSQTFILYNKYI